MRALCILSPLLLTLSCSTWSLPSRTRAEAGRLGPDGSIEMALAKDGRILEIEYHLPPSALPLEIREAADRVMGQGPVVGIEKELAGGELFWEVVKEIRGKKWEVLFSREGKVVNWEIEIEVAEVPQAVLAVADAFAGGGTRTSHEKILDANKNLLSYHVKKVVGGVKVKLAISPDGKLLGAWREVPAEVEVPFWVRGEDFPGPVPPRPDGPVGTSRVEACGSLASDRRRSPEAQGHAQAVGLRVRDDPLLVELEADQGSAVRDRKAHQGLSGLVRDDR